MSASVFPSLPGVSPEIERAPRYRTDVLTMWSGLEVRNSRQTLARVRVLLKVNFARSYVNAPAPWAAYSELGIIKYFHSFHKGSFDSFHIADPDGGADLNVRFADDELRLVQVIPTIWKGELALTTVL